MLLIGLTLSSLIGWVVSEGLDVGPADPFKYGKIEPVSLELASIYVFIVPFVIFVFGIIFVPANLVIIFLFVIPFLVPNRNPERIRRSLDSQLGFIPAASSAQQDRQANNNVDLIHNILTAIQSHGQLV